VLDDVAVWALGEYVQALVVEQPPNAAIVASSRAHRLCARLGSARLEERPCWQRYAVGRATRTSPAAVYRTHIAATDQPVDPSTPVACTGQCCHGLAGDEVGLAHLRIVDDSF
jgi:hypothetical protein